MINVVLRLASPADATAAVAAMAAKTAALTMRSRQTDYHPTVFDSPPPRQRGRDLPLDRSPRRR
ncbi:hypothetical protein [Mycobacterium riyadhense]|uniref:hypothetical protein n=1 Tax=Mycobacterium riyadhense TaxID=486698 RepID=UPI003B9693FD